MQERSPGGRKASGGSALAQDVEAPRKVRSKGGRAPRRIVTAEEIAEEALRIADDEGLDAVSIRRIAAELDVRPMSLYDHFSSKEDLLAKMGDQAVAEVLVGGPLPPHWRDSLATIARRSYETFVRHPCLPILYGRSMRWGMNATKVVEQSAAALQSIPLESSERWTLFGTLNDYVLGHSLRAVAAPEPDQLDDLLPAALAQIEEFASLPDNIRSRTTVERFETGLEIVLDGIERRIAAAAAAGGERKAMPAAPPPRL